MLCCPFRSRPNASAEKQPFPQNLTCIPLPQPPIFLIFIAPSIFVPYWEGNKVWIFLGLYFIETVAKYNKKLARQYLNQYKEQIEKNKNFYELFKPNQKPYKSLFYKADHSMLWASKYLYLDKQLNK